MPDEDARLTDFVPDDGGETPAADESGEPASGGTGESPDPGEDATAGEADDEATPDREAAAASPAVSTADWTPGGGACEAGDCDATAERRWRDDGALVCGDCKEW